MQPTYKRRAGRTITVSGNDADDDFFEKCPASRCAEGGPDIRFPYRLDSSPSFCGAPGMELTCSGNDTVLALPHAGRNITVSGNDADDDFFEKCPASRCAEGGPDIRFPYRLDSSPSFCGAPGMELTCSGNDTVLALQHAGFHGSSILMLSK
ncbi:hypothetical protein ACMD2_22638 [Ananas comosus]|uniref:RING-type E3 ubiquitin transferase n=1 Tax=Ananas comosus TaxID=4615 RepID=A0A199VRW0_ANACO|nr:hypothetical protein ACMD2_22638 [Ananas comosus]